MSGKPLGQVHGSVLSSSAPQRNGKVASIVTRIGGKPRIQECHDVLEHLLHLGVPCQEVDHFGMPAGKGLKSRVVVGVGQASHVENKIGVEGYSGLVAE